MYVNWEEVDIYRLNCPVCQTCLEMSCVAAEIITAGNPKVHYANREPGMYQ